MVILTQLLPGKYPVLFYWNKQISICSFSYNDMNYYSIIFTRYWIYMNIDCQEEFVHLQRTDTQTV